MEDLSQIARDHGEDARELIAASEETGPLPALVDGIDLDTQLKQARRLVCAPGIASPLCAALLDLTLQLAADGSAEAKVREAYAALSGSPT